MPRELINISFSFQTFTDGADGYVDDREVGSLSGGGDSLFFEGGSDNVRAFGGFDSIYLDRLTASSLDGDDTATVEGIGNNIWAGGGDDNVTLQRTAPSDFQSSTVDNQSEARPFLRNNVYLEDGDDRANGSYYADFISGGEGDDVIYGFDGADQIYGDGGRNTIYAGNGDDYVSEGIGSSARSSAADRVFLGAGDDVAALGKDLATDTFTLGAGRDKVIAYGNSPVEQFGLTRATDIVTDFKVGRGGDILDFSNFFGFLSTGTGGSGREFRIKLADHADGALLLINEVQNGPADFDATVLLKGVRAGSLTSANFLFGSAFEPDGRDDGFVPEIITFQSINAAPVFGDVLI